MTNHARNGAARERRVRDHMMSAAWEPIMRAAASKGPADLLLGHPNYGAALVQVGGESKTLGPDDRTRLLRAAWLCSALPIVANVVPRQGIAYWLVVDGPPKTWVRWAP